MLNLERETALKSQCTEVCQAIIDESIGIVEGVRSLVSLSFSLECEDEQPFLGFRGIDSQSDHFPLGELREHWDKNSLAREDANRLEFERDFKEEVIADCREIIVRFRKGAAKS